MTIRLTSRWAKILKWVNPGVLAILTALSLLFLPSSIIERNIPGPLEILFPIGLLAFLFFVVRRRFRGMADSVSYQAGTFKVVMGNTEDEFPLRSVERISDNTMFRPETVTLILKSPSKFGRKITFFPPWSWNPFETHPLALTLQALLNQEKECTSSDGVGFHSPASPNS